MATQSLTLVVGASGSGKSSLVKAGLVHHLKQLEPPAKGWAILPPVRPGTAPMRALEPALAEAARLKIREPERSVLLIVDQLEELVTMSSGNDAARRSFFAALEEARAAGLCVVCTLRADFEPHFLDIARKNPRARFPVRSMSRKELHAVIVGPANDHTLEFAPPSLVDDLIDEVRDSPGALPLLSFTLSELYLERIKRDATDRALTEDDYRRKLGGVTGALGTRADAIYNGLPDDAARQTMSRVLLRLVSLKGGEAAKRRVPKRELTSTDATETGQPEPPIFRGVVDAAYAPSGEVFAITDRAGVVTLRTAAAAATSGEVRHFGGGPDKIVTVRYCPDGATLVTRDAGLRVKLWDAGSGALKQVLDGAADPDSTPTCSHDGRFIAAFDKQDAVLWDAATGARTATSYGSGKVVDPIWHPRKLVAAERVWSFAAQVRLLGPDLGQGPRSFNGNVDGVYDVAWSHDGARLVSGDNGSPGGKNGQIHLYDKVLERAGDGDNEPTRDIPQPGNEKTYSLSWSPDDAYLVTGGHDAGRVWDTRTWTLKSTLAVAVLKQVAWTPSPRSDRIATIDEHGVLRLFEPSTGALVAAPGFGGRTVTRATWNRDGTRLLVLLSGAGARILTVYPEELRAQLCGRAIRNFTREEWKSYFGDGPDEPYRATCEGLPIEPAPAGDAGTP